MARHVHKLLLRAPDHGRLRRGAFLLEDALRTASLPRPGRGRILLVRYLHVGAIDTARGPAALAGAIEAQLRQARLRAVHGADPRAPSAEAVFFDDRAEAYALLALRAARGQPADTWFWPQIGRAHV